jgi:putative transposase
MARRPRYILPGVAVHVIQRAINRVACFRSDSDYLVYLSHVRQLSAKYDCAVHAYCLMTNHVHLLLTPATPDSCTALMRDIGRRYVPYFNRRNERTGTLWEGRFRSCIVESARYVLACYRYIELNPVRAGMVADPAAYPWSSHAANGGVRHDPAVQPHAEFSALSSNPERRGAAYRSLFAEELDDDSVEAIREATNRGYPLVSDAFKESVIAPLGWKVAPEKPGPRLNRRTDSDFQPRIATLTPN